MSDDIQRMLGERTKGRKVRHFEFVDEEDGSTSLDVVYADGSSETFRGVKVTAMSEEPAVGVPLKLTVKP
jgi:hypothetical protein